VAVLVIATARIADAKHGAGGEGGHAPGGWHGDGGWHEARGWRGTGGWHMVAVGTGLSSDAAARRGTAPAGTVEKPGTDTGPGGTVPRLKSGRPNGAGRGFLPRVKRIRFATGDGATRAGEHGLHRGLISWSVRRLV
jgi:hypothetical protein